MDATFLAKIRSDYPEVRIIRGPKFKFRPPRTVVVPSEALESSGSGTSLGSSSSDVDSLLFLHEMGHLLLKHRDFKTEVGRLKMEVAAWEKARELARVYDVFIDEELIEAELDSYREWLHQKSRCPECGLTRFQTPDSTWHCPMQLS